MSHIEILNEDVFEGESSTGYGIAISQALQQNKFMSDASHVVHIVVFGMRFESGKFKISIRVIITMVFNDDKRIDTSAGIDRKKIMFEAEKTRRKYLNKVKNNGRFEDTEYLRHLMHEMSMHDDVILSFNKGSIDDHIHNSLDNTWSINPSTPAYNDIHDAIHQNLNLNGWAEVNLYTQPVDNIARIIPENTGFTRHFVDFATTAKLHEMRVEMQNKFDDYLGNYPANNNASPNINSKSG